MIALHSDALPYGAAHPARWDIFAQSPKPLHYVLTYFLSPASLYASHYNYLHV